MSTPQLPCVCPGESEIKLYFHQIFIPGQRCLVSWQSIYLLLLIMVKFKWSFTWTTEKLYKETVSTHQAACIRWAEWGWLMRRDGIGLIDDCRLVNVSWYTTTHFRYNLQVHYYLLLLFSCSCPWICMEKMMSGKHFRFGKYCAAPP